MISEKKKKNTTHTHFVFMDRFSNQEPYNISLQLSFSFVPSNFKKLIQSRDSNAEL